jgi:hypothetical protein
LATKNQAKVRCIMALNVFVEIDGENRFEFCNNYDLDEVVQAHVLAEVRERVQSYVEQDAKFIDVLLGEDAPYRALIAVFHDGSCSSVYLYGI